MRDAAKVLIRDGRGKILVLYRSETHPQLANDVDLPGGLIDDNESVVEGLRREILEETGLRGDESSLEEVYSWRTELGSLRVIYKTRISSGSIHISWEHKSYTWLEDDEFINHYAIDDFMHQAQKRLARTHSQ